MLKRRASTILYTQLPCFYSSLFAIYYSNLSYSKTHLQRSSKYLVYCNNQISKYGREGNIQKAESIFNRIPHKNTSSWTAMLSAYAQNGQIANARKLFDEIPQRTTPSWNAMITAYVKNNCDVDAAYELFNKMPMRNSVSYAAMITGFVRKGMFSEAEQLWGNMFPECQDPVCSNALISGYLKVGRLEEAIRVFEAMSEKDVVSWTSMVDGYCKKGKVTEARELFNRMPERNVVTWTAMIDGYMKVGCFEDGFGLFLTMRREGVDVNSTTLTSIFVACGDVYRYREGIQIHGLVFLMGFDFDVFLGNSMMTMYSRFGLIDEANKIFHTISRKGVVSWNSMISGYVNNDGIEEAYRLFMRMPVKDLVSWTTMIAGFCNNYNMEKAIELFTKMPEKDDISWTAIILGFVNNGHYEEAFCWFVEMFRKRIRLNALTLSSLLSASAGLATINQGTQVHALALKISMELDLFIQNSLVSMYSKCGNINDAYRIFLEINEPDVVSFNSMITGFAQNGMGKEALSIFKRMISEGKNPNDITFLGVLSACNHVGLLEEGLDYLKSMKPVHDIEPGPDHYACVVDLLGRAGSLDEAIDLIRSMHCEPHAGVWGALLGASRTHLHFDLAKLAALKLNDLQPDSATPYVILSDLYSVSGKKSDAAQVRMAKNLKGIRKSPGCSWIIVKDKVHIFQAGEGSCMDLDEVKIMLLIILKEMKELDYNA